MRSAWPDLFSLNPCWLLTIAFFFKCSQAICLIIYSRILPEKNPNASEVERSPGKDQKTQVLAMLCCYLADRQAEHSISSHFHLENE
jgi:hypothetical protein